VVEHETKAFEALSEAVLHIASETNLDTVLQKLVESARELAGARYAALGVPDGRGGFAKFLTAGMTPKLIEKIGPLPRTHGLLGAMLGTRLPTAPTTSATTHASSGGRTTTRR